MIHDATTGELIYTTTANKDVTLTPHWALFDLHKTNVQCWSPRFADQIFKVEFGDWKMIRTWSPFSVLSNDTERLIWCWEACSGVRTDLEVTARSLSEIALINGAAFITTHVEKECSVYIVPLLLDPLESSERRAQRRPPTHLPSDLPFVRARLLTRGVSARPHAPIASDTHAPLLTVDQRVYRLK